MKPRIYSFSAQLPSGQSSGRVAKRVLIRVILIPRIEMIEGLGPIYPISFLRFSKTFLMDAIYNCNRLDFDSDYSFITNN